jgi:AcrR family transcriptional regulator
VVADLPTASTRDRLRTEAMRLFGEQGYAATSVAQIEAAAGLTPGAGGLYAHFRSKEALLRAGLEALLTPDPDLGEATGGAGARPTEPLAELEGVVRAGLARLEHDRDDSRVLVRDLRRLPDLLELSADRELRPLHDRLEAYLSSPRFRVPEGATARGLAAVLVGATANFWLLADVFGGYPAGVTEDEFVATLARLTATLLTPEDDT